MPRGPIAKLELRIANPWTERPAAPFGKPPLEWPEELAIGLAVIGCGFARLKAGNV